MTRREWLAATWAEWAPCYDSGRLAVAGRVVVFTTRKALQRQMWEHMGHGIEVDRERPGTVAAMVVELNGGSPPATVHRLHAV